MTEISPEQFERMAESLFDELTGTTGQFSASENRFVWRQTMRGVLEAGDVTVALG